MCLDPITVLAVTAVTATALSAGSMVQQGQTANTAAQTNANLARAEAESQAVAEERNAAALEQRAGERTQVAAADADRQRTRNRLQMGEARAAAASSGLLIDGSPLEVLAFNAGEQAKDVESILMQGRFDARDLLAEAELSRWRAGNARTSGRTQASIYTRAGQQAEQAGYVRAGTALLQGAGNAYGRYADGGFSGVRAENTAGGGALKAAG